MDWRDRMPCILLTAAGMSIVVLLLVFWPVDTQTLVLALSPAAVLLAVPVAFALQAFGAPQSVVRKVLPVGVVTGGVLLVVGMSMDGLWWVVAFVLVELVTIAVWAIVALLGYLRKRLFMKQR